MATLISIADGNLTGATTFAAAEVGAGALLLNRFTTNSIINAQSATSPTFTMTNGKVIDAVLLWVRNTITPGSGTFKVDLQKGGVSQASVTVNAADLYNPTAPVPTLFRLTTTATGDGGSNWTIVATGTAGTSVSYNVTANNAGWFSRALRTTTTATPAAADDLYIVGELTGAGTKNNRTVTMDSTAATAYGNGALNSTTVAGGGIHVSNYGTLTYGTTAGTNYLLRVNGDLMVYQFGTLNMGSSAASSGSLVTFDPATTLNTTLSNGNLTATNSNNLLGGVRSSTYLTVGKYYFEVKFGTGTANWYTDCLGILLSSATYVDLANYTNASILVYGSGSIFANGASTSYGVGTCVGGDVIGVAVDVTNRKIWFRRNGGLWNGNGTADPVANVNGVNVIAGSVSPAISFAGLVNTSMIANFGQTAYANAAPSGFSNWSTGGPASTAILEFQQASADGDFGLRCLDNSVVTITGQPRTAGKNVVKCKLTADVGLGNVAGVLNGTNVGTVLFNALDASGNSLLATGYTDNATSSNHGIYSQAPSITNTTQTATVWLARGSGTNNRYIRLMVGNSTNQPAVTNGFYSDIDLQAGTAGTVTAVGTGTATSISIAPLGSGYLIKMTGKCASGVATPSILINSCAVAGTIVYAGNTTQCFIYDHVALVTAASIADTTFNVDTDTGWLSNDAVCVASTTRTASDCEIIPLNASAGASSFTSALYPNATHSGTAPTQAEVGLITRNVKIRSTSNTLMSYVYCTALATVTASWAEFYYLGANTSNKRGIEVDGGAVANPKLFTYCSVHDLDNNGYYFSTVASTSLNVTFSNNVMWNSYSGNCGIAAAVANPDWTFDNNLIMRTAGNGMGLGDMGGTCTNNTVVGTAGATAGFTLSETGVAGVATAIGTFNNNTAHSCGYGLIVGTFQPAGIVNNFTSWRVNTAGVFFNAPNVVDDLVFNNLILFGNGNNFYLVTGDAINITGTNIICSDTTFPSANGIVSSGPNNAINVNINNVDFSGSTGIFAPNTTADINFAPGFIVDPRGTANNCKFGAPTAVLTNNVWLSKSYIGMEKYNRVAGDHRTVMTYGQLRTDSAVYHSAAPSMRMTPNTAGVKLESAPQGKGMLVAVNSGKTVTASVWVRKDTTYTGAQPRLIVRANPAIGINNDTVLATCSDLTSMTYATWDAATITAVTLSGGNLVATNIGTTSADQGARVAAALGGKTAGKYYFEVTCTSIGGGIGSNLGICVATVGSTYTAMGANATTGVNFYPVSASGGIYSNGGLFGGVSLGQRSTGNIIGLAVDLDNRKLWFRLAPSGNWNGNAGDSPVTPVGGVTIPAGTMTPLVTFGGVGGIANCSFTANFGASTFSSAVPSGFTSGWTIPAGGTGTGVWNQITGTTITATDDGAVELIVDCDGTTGFINIDDWTASTS